MSYNNSGIVVQGTRFLVITSYGSEFEMTLPAENTVLIRMQIRPADPDPVFLKSRIRIPVWSEHPDLNNR